MNVSPRVRNMHGYRECRDQRESGSLECHSPSEDPYPSCERSLFPVDGKVVAGKATGKLCTLCAMPIFATEVEHEVMEPQTAYAHMTCHSLWVQESKILGKSRE